MTLKLGPIPDEKPIKVTIDVPPEVYRDLTAYAGALAAATGHAAQGPARLIVPMLTQFMASDREFAKVKRQNPSGS